jgi:hypothetical protein
MAVVIAAIAVLLALLFLASRAVARSPGFVAGWMRGTSFTPPPPPPGTQEDDDFRWRWHSGALRTPRRAAPPEPMLEELMTTREDPDLHTRRLEGRVGRRR